MEYKELQLKELKKTVRNLYGEPTYLFNADQFIRNFTDLQNEFRKIYPNTAIAYSYKTNHIPGIGKLVKELNGYAEVVSDTEAYIADKVVKCRKDRIIYNGLLPSRNMHDPMEFGAIVNVESMEHLNQICEYERSCRGVGIRIGEEDSRFGFQESELFGVLAKLAAANVKVRGIHCHIGGSRSLETWQKKTERMVRIAKDVEIAIKHPLEYIDLGGHLYGRMDPGLKEQFGNIPTFEEYAKTVAPIVRDAYKDKKTMPKLILEPGTALVADTVSILATVQNTKRRNGKIIATLDVSSYDCGMVADYKNLTIENITTPDANVAEPTVVCGYTCMEEDYINRDCKVALRTGDCVLIKNCGAYSASMKGNFIMPPIGMFMVNDNFELLQKLRDPGNETDIIRRCYIGGASCEMF